MKIRNYFLVKQICIQLRGKGDKLVSKMEIAHLQINITRLDSPESTSSRSGQNVCLKISVACYLYSSVYKQRQSQCFNCQSHFHDDKYTIPDILKIIVIDILVPRKIMLCFLINYYNFFSQVLSFNTLTVLLYSHSGFNNSRYLFK